MHLFQHSLVSKHSYGKENIMQVKKQTESTFASFKEVLVTTSTIPYAKYKPDFCLAAKTNANLQIL
jgi:hypothetical protein